MLLCDSEEYRMSPPGNRNIKRFISFHIDDLKLYQPSHKNLKAMSEMIVQACYGVKKCAEIIFSWGKKKKGEGLNVLNKKVKSPDPDLNESYKFLECEQAEAIKADLVYNE